MAGDAIADLMRRVDALDDALVDLLTQRFALSRQIGELKAKGGQALFDPLRVQAQIARFADRCAEVGLERRMSQQLMSIVIGQVVVERLAHVTPSGPDRDREQA